MKLAAIVLTLLAGVGATLALTMAPAPVYKPKHVNLVPTGKNVTLEIEGAGQKRRVVVSAEVCLREGVLEQLLTRKGTKEHEAVLAADVDARDIHKALLAAGATQGCPVRYAPNFAPANGQVIRVSVEWEGNGKPRRARAQDWVRDLKTKAPMAHDWVFAGSQLLPDPQRPNNVHYLANDGDVICVANFESALLDLPIRSSKDQADLAFEANTPALPPVGTKVRLILEPVPAGGK